MRCCPIAHSRRRRSARAALCALVFTCAWSSFSCGDDGSSPDAEDDDAEARGPTPSTPTIIEPSLDGQLLHGADVHMETAPFEHSDPARQHRCTDWEIWTIEPRERVWFSECVRGLQRVHAHLGDGAFLGSHEGRRELEPEREFLLRVRHRDDSDDPELEWSAYAERPFRTDAQKDPLPDAPNWLVLQDGFVVEEVAAGFRLPVNIAFVPRPVIGPEDPYFYVTELHGTIKVVYQDFRIEDYASGLLNYDPTARFPGGGERGITGIAVEPESGDLFVSMLYEGEDGGYPRILRMHSEDGGRTAASQTVVLDMRGELQGESHQVSAVTIGPDARLYVHNGDGFDVSTAQDLDSFRGKILRLELDGSATSDNPFFDEGDGIGARDYVFAYGFRNPFGGAWRDLEGALYAVENGPFVDRFIKVVEGHNYGWDGSDGSIRQDALYVWEKPVAPVNVAFVEGSRFHGSGFPEAKYGHAFVSESGPTYAPGPQEHGKRISEISFTPDNEVADVTPLVEYNGTGRATVAALAAGPDGLYFSDLYPEDSSRGPADPGAKLYRVRHDPGARATARGDAGAP
jgi:glucose/arabinose dehydrogenase